jgi:SH3 domain protein
LKLVPAVLICFALVIAAPTRADDTTRFVRDWISVPLYEAATADSRKVHTGITSGTEVTLVRSDERNGFSLVRTTEGTEGWIAARYLMEEPTARMQLDNATKELTELRKVNAELQAQQSALPLDKREAAQQLAQLTSANAQLQSELQALQQAPDSATQLAQENIELKKENTELHTQVDTHTNAVADLQRSQNYALFREGGLAVVAGALLMLLAAHMWPKKKKEWF